MPEILYGLEAAEYRHPAERAAQEAVEKAVLVNKLGQALEDFENSCQDQIRFLGNDVRLTEHNAPRITGLLEQAKEVLDHQGEIALFTGRSYSFRIEVAGGRNPTIRVSDAIVRRFPDAYILFLFGQAVTVIKARLLKVLKLANGYGALTDMVPLAGRVLKLPLGVYMRKVQLTADRGGLLACQDYNVAMRYLTLLSGVPMKDLESVDLDARMEQIRFSDTEEKDLAEAWGHVGETLFNDRRAWTNERFVEMFNWHASGEYGRIIQAHT